MTDTIKVEVERKDDKKNDRQDSPVKREEVRKEETIKVDKQVTITPQPEGEKND